MDWKKIKYFKQEEFVCHHCNQEHMNEEFMFMLDAARDYAGVPFKINSGYRCQEYDDVVAGPDPEVDNHVTGKAADIAVTSSRHRYLILQGLLDAGFNRIGVGKTFFHVDTCGVEEDKPIEVVWLY